MKLCRIRTGDRERPGVVSADGTIRDISGICPEITADILSRPSLARLAAIDLDGLPPIEGSPHFGVPFQGMTKYIGIGLNYVDHAHEAGLKPPTEPIVFLKATSAICGPNDDTIMPRGGSQLDWEVELGVVIGEPVRDVITEHAAIDHVAGYCVLNDVSERAFQMQSSQWDKGKGCDTFGPVGPWLVTCEEIPDPQNLRLWLDVNGERMQDGSTSRMIFGVGEIIAYLSRYMTLFPGDIIATGTPAGVGLGREPSRWLRPGDVVSLGIDGLGEQRQRIVGREEAPG